MSDDRSTFEQTKARLEDILEQVRRKDTSLEQSLELLEEGVRLANRCNELIDQTSWRAEAAAGAEAEADEVAGAGQDDTAPEDASTDDRPADGGTVDDGTAVVEAVDLEDDERS
jgi:exodeoxyribonuclease VII small subunit